MEIYAMYTREAFDPFISLPNIHATEMDQTLKKKKPAAVVEEPKAQSAQSARTYGYARVSTIKQSTELQIEELKRNGCDEVISDDAYTGANTARPGLQKLLKLLKKGDTLVVWKLDRLGRSLVDLVRILESLLQIGIEFRSLRESIDTKTPIGRFMWHLIAAFAELERESIKERVQAGIERAHAQGIKFGRPQRLSGAQLEELKRMHAEGKGYKYIMDIFGIGRTTVVKTLQRIRGLRPSA